MSPNKREREYARRRYEKWEARRRAKTDRRRRLIAWVTIGAVVVATVAGAVVVLVSTRTPPADTAPSAASSVSPEALLYDGPPAPDEAEGRTWPIILSTSAGDLAIELDGATAPQAVASFLMLARDGFFDGTECHRLVTGSLLQCGDPTGTGTGGPGYSFGPIENAPPGMVYPAGTVAMARQADNAESQGSQFFIVFADTPLPDDAAGGYTVFGQVTAGLDVLTAVDAGGTVDGGTDGRPAVPVTIEGVVIP